MTPSPGFSLIILCYRSEESILEFARTAKKMVESLTDSFEIVLVGNYFENSGEGIFFLPSGLGYGNANGFNTGIAANTPLIFKIKLK